MSAKSLGIVHVTSEMTPLAKVGGLGDVVGALSQEQARRGHRVIVAIPAYRSIAVPAGWTRRRLEGREVPWGLGREPAGFELLEPAGNNGAESGAAGTGTYRVLLVEHLGDRRFFDRDGIYDDPVRGHSFPDGAERFLFFARAALEGLAHLGEPIDILHAHDHQAGWVPCFARTHLAGEPAFARCATVFTIHNLGYQGIHDSWVLGLAGFGRELFYPTGPFEFFGRVNDMKVGLTFADQLSTVSPRYAREIRTGGEFGFGLEGVLQRRAADLRGIVNGIDVDTWDPARDPSLPFHYDREHPEGKARVRAALRDMCGFPTSPDWPLIGTVSRLVDQKGFDLIEQAEAELLKLEARFVVLGAGQARYQELFTRLMIQHPNRFYYRAGFDERFAHLIEGGCDLFLMPSRYEPCGLNQMYSLRYGTLPVVRETGGLADTVMDFDPETREGWGFVFQRYDPGEMVNAIRRGLTAWRQRPLWSELMQRGMGLDFSWKASADGYDRLYADALERVRSGRVPTLESVRARI
ncbi:MAG TPA: glycogen/starch synthase [Candidatus Eisenbacteria bacterium]|nr:glycogen/starch synthase [Candidatus Eisenbacteria bacterium]